MSNNFSATGFTVTTTFTQLSTLLTAAGIDTTTDGAVTADSGYIKNNSASINLRIGTGSSSPTSYIALTPITAVLFNKGLNTNEVWLASASSTVTADFAEGASGYEVPTISGIIGTITLADNAVPKGSSGNLVASSMTDDGVAVTIAENVIVTGTSTLTGATALGAKIAPSANDGAPLGDTTHNFSDLFLATGAVINYANGNVAVTHSSGILTMGTGEMRITSAGTNTASVITVGSTSTLTNKTLTSPAINTPTINSGAALGATSTEIDQFNDVSAYQESILAAGALTITKKYSGLALVGAGAVTLAAPGATMLGQTKTIEMTADNGDVTLALTNVEGQSSGTTATFNDVGDGLVLIALASKWLVLKEFGIALS